MTMHISERSPVVLIADDLEQVIGDYEAQLSAYDIESLKATSLRELIDVFVDNMHLISAIILDGCIPGNRVNTIGFIKAARRAGFDRPIIAASSLLEYRVMMVAAGCSHQAPKEDAVELVAELLSAR